MTMGNLSWKSGCAWAVIWFLFVGVQPLAYADAQLANAVEHKNQAEIDQLLENGCEINCPQGDGMTALHWAVYHNDYELAKRLVKHGANVNAQNRYGVMPLYLACLNGDTKTVKFLLEQGAVPNATLRGGETVLMTAARVGKAGSVTALLDHGARVDTKNHDDQTAIMWAAAEGHSPVVETLIEAGADFQQRLDSGFNPFFFAVREGHRDVVHLLLEKGANVNAVLSDDDKLSPLLLAVENGHFELAVELLKAGADPDDQRSGFTALHTITWVRKPDSGDGGDPAPKGSGTVSSLEFVRTLVEDFGADVNAQLKRGRSRMGRINKQGATPFLFAADRADVPLMQLLLELGADPLLPNAENTTPLMAAAGFGTIAPTEEAGTEPEALVAVKLILQHGGDVNTVNDRGETVMHGAAYASFPQVVHLLAEHGADITIWNNKNKHGWTPLLIAQGYRPGNFKPSAQTIAAIEHVMREAGVEPPASPQLSSKDNEFY